MLAAEALGALIGAWKTGRASVPHVLGGGLGGSVVITSSLASVYANENTAHYSAAKVGLAGLMKVLAKEVAPHSIRVNTIHPTTVATGMILNHASYRLFRLDLAERIRADFEIVARTPNKPPVAALEPVDISQAILYLDSTRVAMSLGSGALPTLACGLRERLGGRCQLESRGPISPVLPMR